ncbi:hypothetical protein [Streptosporangium sp. CA-115845]
MTVVERRALPISRLRIPDAGNGLPTTDDPTPATDLLVRARTGFVFE